MNIVIDTNVFVAAFRSQTGASFQIVSMIFTTKIFTVHLSTPLLTEYESKIRERTPISFSETDEFLSNLKEASVVHKIYYLFQGFLRDTNDDMLLELAVKSQSSYIVSHNIKDLQGAISFGVTPITPKDFLTILRQLQ
ncbi:MAG: putative toxin-antitoxin system toxin component, PIN family [Candidatus Kapaibacterium sp.]|nr:MAG: putative toxin-antitoxin system toxin component, PIN family [Candidatus Kapabacteria bacterium]